MKISAILTYDIGTSALKACLWDWSGRVIATEEDGYEVRFGRNGEADQTPDDWLRAAKVTTARLLDAHGTGHTIEAIGLTGQMSGCVLADAEGNARLPGMTWQDRRAAEVIRSLSSAISEERFYQLTGQRFDAGLPFAKLLWIQEHYPELIRGATLFDAQNWLAHRLTGARVTDISNGSGTGLMDIRKREWSKEICTCLRIPESVLPDILSSSAIAGGLLPDMAAELGLVAGTPVIIGMGDGPSSCLGLGITSFGQGYCQIGTSAWISTYNDDLPTADSGLLTYAYMDGYVPTGSIQAAGQALVWAAELFGNTALTDYPNDKLPLHLPYMFGERSPFWFHEPRGTFLHLAGWHGKNELYTAVLEGVGFQLRFIKDIFRQESLLAPDCPLLISGGLLRTNGVIGMLSDTLGEDIIVTDDPVSSTGLGAYFCARACVENTDPMRLAETPPFHKLPGRKSDPIVAKRYESFLHYAMQLTDSAQKHK